MIARQRAGEKMTRKGKKKTLDAIVAAGLLQAYLDGKLLPLAGSTAGVRERKSPSPAGTSAGDGLQLAPSRRDRRGAADDRLTKDQR